MFAELDRREGTPRTGGVAAACGIAPGVLGVLGNGRGSLFFLRTGKGGGCSDCASTGPTAWCAGSGEGIPCVVGGVGGGVSPLTTGTGTIKWNGTEEWGGSGGFTFTRTAGGVEES